MSILPAQHKITTTRGKRFCEVENKSAKTIFGSKPSKNSRVRNQQNAHNVHNFLWNAFSSRSHENPNRNNIIVQKSDSFHSSSIDTYSRSSSDASMAIKKQSSPLLIKTRSRSSRLYYTPSTSLSSSYSGSLEDQTILANQYIYNMATWRMYRRIEQARARKRMQEGIMVTHIPKAFIPMCNSEVNTNELKNEQKYFTSECSSDICENEEYDGDMDSIQFHLDI